MEAMLSFRSVWEAECVIGVADYDVERLKCDRGGRFYRASARRRGIDDLFQVSVGDRIKCDRDRRFYRFLKHSSKASFSGSGQYGRPKA